MNRVNYNPIGECGLLSRRNTRADIVAVLAKTFLTGLWSRMYGRGC